MAEPEPAQRKPALAVDRIDSIAPDSESTNIETPHIGQEMPEYANN